MAQKSLVLRGTMKAHTDWVTAIATPIDNSDMIVTSSRDKSIIVWSLTKDSAQYGVPRRRFTSQCHFVQDVVLGMESFTFGIFKENRLNYFGFRTDRWVGHGFKMENGSFLKKSGQFYLIWGFPSIEGLPKMVLVDLVFHYGGEWIREPKLFYVRKLVHKWEGYDSVLSYIDITNEYINILGYMCVQKLIVFVPSGKYYEIEGDEGFRTLLSFVNDKFDAINLFVAEDSELDVDVENHHILLKVGSTKVQIIDDVATDCTSDGTENDSDASTDNSDYNSEELEVLAQERKRVIDGSLCDYKDLHMSMTFKDIAKARKYISLHSLANGYNLTIKKVTKRFRVVCEEKCNFVCLISGEKHSAGVSVKTLKREQKCDDTCGNYKCKRAKRMILEDIEGSFCDDYKKLVGYANALKEPDVVLKDSMNHFYPIAWAIVDRECKVSGVWFLEFLQKSLNINSGEGITFMSDMQKIANMCELNFNGDDGFEASEGNDRHIVNLTTKKCTCRVWDLTGIPCPYSIKALLYKNLDPLEEIHW
ncbi:hypothetical protein MTR67_051845 [Solanum verrucosum]|uniref:Zinc finger PMZ-type domain-containing protein n=1 Tax=Solanum verrucosum TaxID=315347 RepID=A0AAF1A2T2_SOLVR|nr:hypothetical protein MTR67_051845 [Solanum verrucosum]